MTVLLTGIVLFLSTKTFAAVVATDVQCTSACISATEIASSAVTSTKIQSSAVTSAKIQDSAVTSAKISDGTITSADILDGTIANTDISSISASKISGSLNADTLDSLDSSNFVSTSGGTIGSLTVTNGNITSSGDICIGVCP